MRTENMTQQNAIQIFEGNQVRVAWNEEEEKYYFSIVDVVQILTEQPTPRKASTYWAVLKKRLKEEGADELLTNCKQLKLPAADGAHATIGQIASFLAFFRQTVCEEMQCEIDIVRNADKDTWWYDGQRIHFRSGNGSRLLALLCDKSFVTFSEMADSLSVNRSAVQKQVEGFRKKGYLDRRDDGSWHVLALNSNIKKA